MEAIYNRNELSKLLGVSERLLHKFEGEGLVPTRLGHQVKYRESAVQAFIEQQTQGPIPVVDSVKPPMLGGSSPRNTHALGSAVHRGPVAAPIPAPTQPRPKLSSSEKREMRRRMIAQLEQPLPSLRRIRLHIAKADDRLECSLATIKADIEAVTAGGNSDGGLRCNGRCLEGRLRSRATWLWVASGCLSGRLRSP